MSYRPKSSVFNPFFGKVASLYGDSITFGGGSNYTTKLIANLGLSACYSHGYNGHTLGEKSGFSTSLANSTKLDAIIANAPNLVFILAGTNDNGGGVVLGAADSNVVTTTSGGLNYILSYLQNALPLCRIVVCTPSPQFYTGWTQFQPNGLGLRLVDYVDGIKAVCKRRAIPVLDLYSNFGVNEDNFTNFYTDGLHFKDSAYIRLTNMQAAFVRTL